MTSLDELLTSTQKISDFIQDELKYRMRPSKLEILRNGYPDFLSLYNTNWEKKPKRSYYLFGVEVMDIYAYTTERGFCLYIFIPFNKKISDAFITVWGMAENITALEAETGDFDFLYWKTNDIEKSINHFRRDKNGPQALLFITNIYEDRINTDPVD